MGCNSGWHHECKISRPWGRGWEESNQIFYRSQQKKTQYHQCELLSRNSKVKVLVGFNFHHVTLWGIDIASFFDPGVVAGLGPGDFTM